MSGLTGFDNDGRSTIIRSMVLTCTALLILGYTIVFVIGFFSLRHAEVKIRATLGGGDSDEVLSSATARCCLALQTHTKRVRKALKSTMPKEDDITVSPIYKAACISAIYLSSPIRLVIAFLLLGMWSVDKAYWTVGAAFLMVNGVSTAAAIAATLGYIFLDLKRELR